MAVLTKRVTVTMPREQKARLVAVAERRGLSLGALLREIMSDLLAEHQCEVARTREAKRKTDPEDRR